MTGSPTLGLAVVPAHVASAQIPHPRNPNDRRSDVLGLLAAGIPLTLLLDLASPWGPDSRSILDVESIEVQMSHTA